MRLAIVTEYYRPTLGGIQEHVFHFARELRRRGHSVTVVTSGHDGHRPGAYEAGVIRLGRSVPVDAHRSVGRDTVGISLGRRLRELLVPSRVDLVHLHAPLSPVLPVLAARSTGLPLVGTFHTHFRPSALMRFMRRTCQRLVDRLDVSLAVSDVCVRSLAPYVRAPFQIVPNGVDVATWEAGRPVPYLREGRPAVLFVGRLELRSGLDRILSSWKHMPRGCDPLLLIVGDGPERQRLQHMARELNVPARFLGARWADRPDIYASADIMVCPTTIASFGITLLEGMAAGLPVIASDIEGFREVVRDGRDGLLVDTSRPAVLGAAMGSLLADPSWRTRLVREGRYTAAEYDWARVTDRVIPLFGAAVG